MCLPGPAKAVERTQTGPHGLARASASTAKADGYAAGGVWTPWSREALADHNIERKLRRRTSLVFGVRRRLQQGTRDKSWCAGGRTSVHRGGAREFGEMESWRGKQMAGVIASYPLYPPESSAPIQHAAAAAAAAGDEAIADAAAEQDFSALVAGRCTHLATQLRSR